ncbi:MAG: DNA methylase [Lachnospiraceae bacterium]|nr:DNA methylase [Lachnospiraceae bacterium]
MNKQYLAIDLKSFYASVECMELDSDPLTTNLVVADNSRTEKTICLAVSPALKSFGIPGRPRLFEVISAVELINIKRAKALKGKAFSGESCDINMLKKDPTLKLAFHIATPKMAKYMEISSEIVGIYLKYVSPEDMHIYSVDEVFIDVTSYLNTYRMSAHELCMKMIKEVLDATGITATAGIGTNLYLAKIAMDIVAKHMPADKDGVRIAELNESDYRHYLWTHRPLTDFWRVGMGYAAKLEDNGIFTMGDIARVSLDNEDLLFRLFGVNAELLIDHAWGYEDTEISEIKSYIPQSHSISQGQVLKTPYPYDKARLIVREMTELLVLDLVDKGMVCDQIVLTVGYDIENLNDPIRKAAYKGPIHTDHYGRQVPQSAHGSINLGRYSSSTKLIVQKTTELFESIVDDALLVRRMYVVANHVIPEGKAPSPFDEYEQLDIFTDYDLLQQKRQREEAEYKRENKAQKAVLSLQKKFGKNAVLKGMNLEEGAMTIERNGQIGGHKA